MTGVLVGSSLGGCEKAPAVSREPLQLVKQARSESERKGKELREKPIRGFSRFQSEVFQNFFEVLKNLLRLSKTLFRQPETAVSAVSQLVKKVRSESERKGKELREKPIRGFSRFQSEVFWNFLKVQKTCSGWRKHFFDSLSPPSLDGGLFHHSSAPGPGRALTAA